MRSGRTLISRAVSPVSALVRTGSGCRVADSLRRWTTKHHPARRFQNTPSFARSRSRWSAQGVVFEILDASFRCVYFSSEAARLIGRHSARGRAHLRKVGDRPEPQGGRRDREGHRGERNGVVRPQRADHAPVSRSPDPEFEEVFGPTARGRGAAGAGRAAPRAWYDVVSFPPGLRFRRSVLGDQNQVQLRINDDAGRISECCTCTGARSPRALLHRLGRGDPRLFERMERVSEPRRPAGILFADLEASGALSRRLSSRGYFDLIRDLTDLIDTSVIARDGISASTRATEDRRCS